MKTLTSLLLFGLTAYSAVAQTAPVFTSTCDERNYGNTTNKRYCETRDLTMTSPGSQTLTIDGQTNGGISVQGWDGNDVRVRAKISTWAKTDADATGLAKGVTISTSGNVLRATGAKDLLEGWAVSYEVFVPRKTALALNTVNGGISLNNLESSIRFETVNGGIALSNVAGKVKGQTTNGGVTIKLTGSKWEGEGLDVQTTNGGINWNLPKDYSAQLYTSTNAGGISASGLPVTKSGLMHKEITATLGQGGASVKAVTTNGGIKVSRD
ncbi:DUF4097 family beta strand repeat-containing protein [Hymenobacter elongatus]|uniref:DUF4097 domain-containing protein n=1 Tax=Hymenobacter elongatus TaxID=877208 RepID=A0A4Z0PEG1_9BACT|nr:DUF4097 family beta strand repeat-containing protein [Hymenobacter elongatus]TGE11898.1 hypothetical protein E5J99_20670 [Hymenobacter elongatus]